MTSVKHLFIVGAGFSRHAGLPLTNDFTEALLDVEELKIDGPSRLIVNLLKKFVYDTFRHKETADAKFWPHLEDIFTCIDLSANTGHHLGATYAPSDLRTIRRALIVRTIRMLEERYSRAADLCDYRWRRLQRFFSGIKLNECAFLSTNWDTVIEQGLERVQHVDVFDYRCDATLVQFEDAAITLAERRAVQFAQILKPHGSINWLYCDACRQLFWVHPSETWRIANQLFRASDWAALQRLTGKEGAENSSPYICPVCDGKTLGTRFATFSYRKALDFPMYERSWLETERLLRNAANWIFIGYSLPAADFEFKHLLKHVQLSRPTRPKLMLIAGGGKSARATLSNYQKFFGPEIRTSNETFFDDGLDKNAMKALRMIGALHRLKKPANPRSGAAKV